MGNGKLTLQVEDKLINQGKIISNDKIELATKNIDNSTGNIIAVDNVALNIKEKVNNLQGKIKAGNDVSLKNKDWMGYTKLDRNNKVM